MLKTFTNLPVLTFFLSSMRNRCSGGKLLVSRAGGAYSSRDRDPHRKFPVNCQALVILDDVLKSNDGGKSMFHLLWYILIGLISGVIAKSAMHVHIAIFWTVVLGIIGSILGGGVTHMFSRPTNERYHPAGLLLSTLGAILILYICYKLNIHFPQV
jgi:uncharacterized membrane protein YeaQ/YmgE (transglycosylase-associated protein family)